MRAGRDLRELAAELERQRAAHKDYIAPQGALDAVVVGDEVKLAGLPKADPVGLTPYAHGQMATHLGIPQKYYDKMRVEQPDLLARNIQTWLHADAENKRMVRTLDGQVRGFLSAKFRPLDNYDLADAVLPTLIENGVQVLSAELTETRLYIKGILPALSDPEFVAAVATGQHLYGQGLMSESRLVAAVVISNSDIGAGTLRVEPSVFTTRCTNMAVIAAAAMRKYHVGRAFSADEAYELFKDETRQADDRAFWLKVRDVTKGAFTPDIFNGAVAQVRSAQGQKLLSEDLPKVVDLTVKELALPERASTGILAHLAKGGDFSAWGLSSAITEVANVTEDYEEATLLERAGGQVLALPPARWDAIAKAA